MASSTYAPIDIITQPGAVTARMRKTGNQTALSAATWTKATWEVTDFDTDGAADLANERYVIRTPGKYFVQATISYASTATAVRRIVGLWKGEVNVGTELRRSDRQHVGTADWDTYVVGGIFDFAAGDVITVGLWSVNAVTPVTGGAWDNAFEIVLLSGNANGTPSGVKVQRVAALNQTSNGNFQALAWDTLERDSDGMWNPALPTRLTARTAGWYFVTASYLLALSNAGTQRVASIVRGSDGDHLVHQGFGPSATVYPRVSLPTLVYLTAGDYVEVQTWQDTGGNLAYLTSGPGSYPTEASMVRVDSNPPVSTRSVPSARVYRTSALSVSNTWIDVPAQAARWDDDSMYVSGVGIVIRTPGTYEMGGTVIFGGGGSGIGFIGMAVNGTRVVQAGPFTSDATAGSAPAVTTRWKCKVGDVITMQLWKSVTQVTYFSSGAPVECDYWAELVQPISKAALMTPEADHLVGTAGEPGFQNGWGNYGSGYSSAGFYKDPLGRVHLKGLVNSGTVGATMFTMPVGYRPLQTVLNDVQSNGAMGRVDVQADGLVVAVSGSNAWFSLEGISYRAA